MQSHNKGRKHQHGYLVDGGDGFWPNSNPLFFKHRWKLKQHSTTKRLHFIRWGLQHPAWHSADSVHDTTLYETSSHQYYITFSVGTQCIGVLLLPNNESRLRIDVYLFYHPAIDVLARVYRFVVCAEVWSKEDHAAHQPHPESLG